MGGQSHSTLNINNGIAVWNGETKIVPKLHAPGFCNVKSTSGGGVLRIANDASPFTHMLLRVRSTIKYTGFKVSFAADTWNPTFQSFKSDFTVQRNDGVWHTVAVPFENFSNDWSQYTGRCDTTDPNGKKHKCCSAEHPEVCPTKSNLKHISQLGIWAEGVAGKFHLEVKWIRAGTVFDKSIVEVAVGNKDLSTLVTALTAGKLVTALEGEGPFTVFAPSNEAFAKLPKATLNSLLEPKNIKQLDAVLEYHVVAGAAVFSKNLKSSQRVKTLQGSTILVQRSWRGVYINGKSKVTTADVKATNGVVHIINTVLLPPQPKKKCVINVPAAKQPEYAFEFAALDKNHNGYLNAAEFKNMGVKLATKFEDHNKKGHTWGKSWGGRRLRSSWLEALQRRMKERRDAYRAARVFKKFDDNNSHYISLCEFENAMYKESLKDGGDNNDGPVVVHG